MVNSCEQRDSVTAPQKVRKTINTINLVFFFQKTVLWCMLKSYCPAGDEQGVRITFKRRVQTIFSDVVKLLCVGSVKDCHCGLDIKTKLNFTVTHYNIIPWSLVSLSGWEHCIDPPVDSAIPECECALITDRMVMTYLCYLLLPRL